MWGQLQDGSLLFISRLREIISLELDGESEAMFGGEMKVDESCFGGVAKACEAEIRPEKIPGIWTP
jgi:hypothetical protein